MIRMQDYTPDIYYKESRDFQFIGHLYDLVLNYIKTNVDLLSSLPLSDSSDDKFLELMAMTFGLKPEHHYNSVQLRALCKVFPKVMRNKGSIESIIAVCTSLFNAEGLEQQFSYDFVSEDDRTELNLYVPQDFSDITLLNDILSYVLPAGMSCNIIKELQIKEKAITETAVEHIIKLYHHDDEQNKVYEYDNNILAKIPQLFNYDNLEENRPTLNTGEVLRGLVQDKIGFIANGIIYKPQNNNGD